MRDAFLFRHSCWFLAGAAFVTPRRGKGHYTSCMYNDRYLLICIAACGWLIVALAGADIGASMVTNVRKEIGGSSIWVPPLYIHPECPQLD